MKKEAPLCMGCMAEMKSGDICAVCGYDRKSAYLSSYLAPSTFLADRYIIGKLISYNGEGALYLAMDTVSGVKVTVREYMPDTLCGRKKGEERVEVDSKCVALYKTYLSEFADLNRSLMNIGQSLRIQRTLDVFYENNTAYAVCEYIAGISLKSYLSNLGGVLPWEQVKELFTPLFTTLNIIHAEGIIHRGISPSTILLNDKTELILINFGITASRTYGSEINYEVYSGYAGPEQYSSTARHGSWTDVYGVAAVLYKVLTGQMPPDAISRKESADSENSDKLTAPMLINRNVPPSVSAAITKGLALGIDERTSSVGEFIDGLFSTSQSRVPDGTDEIIIKKPPRKTETEIGRAKPGARRPDYPKSRSERRTSNAAAITVCVMLGLVFLTFIGVMILSAANPDMFGSWTANTATNKETGSSADGAGFTGGAGTANVKDGAVTSRAETGSDEPLYRIPDFTSRSFEAIQNRGYYMFLKFVPEYEYNAEYPEGEIFWQDVPPDTEVVNGTEISIKVSKGPETVKLPVFKGKKFMEYENELFAAKIKYEIKGEYSGDVAKDYVTRCSVEAGDIINIARGDTVKVYYSLGPAPALAASATSAKPQETVREPDELEEDE